MILICQPKSGSTSLIDTLKNCGYKTCEVYKIKGEKLDDFTEIQKYHSNTDLRNKSILTDMIESEIIYREHLLPCLQHFETIEESKKPILVLLRNPEYSFDSYERYLNVYGKKAKPELLQDLKKFNSEWKEFAKRKKYVLLIDYKDIVKDFKNTFMKIIIHFGLKIPDKYDSIILSKRLYTGVGEAILKNESD
jgi:hypothetical protein